MHDITRVFSFDTLFSQGQMRIPAGDIFQVAELSLIRGSEMSNHYQYCDEFTYAVSGQAKVWYGDEVMEMSAGQIHYVKQGKIHRIEVSPEQNFHYYCIGFRLDPTCPSSSSFLELIRDKESFLIGDDGQTGKLFTSLMNEIFLQDPDSTHMIHFYFSQMLVSLSRIMRNLPMTTSSRTAQDTSSYAAYRAKKYIDTHYIKLSAVRQITAELPYSEYYLSHVFREKMGITMKDYLLQKKLATAAELLRSSNMSVTVIGEHLRFASIHAFSGAFKRYFHMSPSAFRKQVHN